MSNQNSITLCLVVPCYNEEQILSKTINTLLCKLDNMSDAGLIRKDSHLLLVDDGSSDGTWNIIAEFHKKYPEKVGGLKLAGNCGHQAALLAGLMEARKNSDAVISLDADLQDDIGIFDEFVKKFQEGKQIVYGIRNNRSSDSFLKKYSALLFYRLMEILGANTIYNHADYRLMGQQSLDALAEYREYNIFLRGIIPHMGFPHDYVCYARKKADRPTHYSLVKMLSLAWDGITSFSVKLIHVIAALGGLCIIFSIVEIAYFLYRHFSGQTVPGWTSIAILILLLGGIQLLSIGIIGEYLAKVYMESKHRPLYIIEKKLTKEQ